jgi:predicted ATPase/DNA-binding CsgD family transcriptional regulator
VLGVGALGRDEDVSWDGAGSLPVALSSLVGRQAELDTLATLVPRARLLTIVGTGGCGKTRLALAVAERCQPEFTGGVRWVGLETLVDPRLLPAMVGTAVSVPESPGEDAVAAVCRCLASHKVLLVLDNCEHVVERCAELAEQLLRCCPSLTILATSRELIGASGERVFRLGGLEIPGARPAEESSDALTLFAERAEAISPGFRLDTAGLRAAGQLCRLLDGLPLALELAAARVGSLGLAEIVARLAEGQQVLRHPGRTAPVRHQTLNATLDWSHRLLSRDEQALFRRLSVFPGSFSLLAAELVTSSGEVERKNVVELLAALVDKSLVHVAGQGLEQRYRLLNTVQQYARARLAESGELAAIQRAHGEFYLALAEQARAGLEGADQSRWLQRLAMEHDNLSAALARQLPADPESGGRLAAMLWPYWYRRGSYQEARCWLEQATLAGGQMSGEVRADVLTGAGVLAFLQCDYPAAAERLRQAQALYERQGHLAGTATTLQRLGSIAREQGHYPQARQLHQQSLATWSELGDAAGVAASEDYLGFVAWLEGNADEAELRCARALAYFEGTGRRQEAAAALVNMGVAAHYAGEDERASARLRRALELSREIDYLEGVAWTLHELGIIADRSDPGAATMLADSLTIHVQLGDRWRAASVLETIAGRCAGSAPADAARLLAASHRLRQALTAPVPPAERPAHDAALATTQAALGAAEFGQCWNEGLSLPLDAAVELARQAAGQLRPGGSAAEAGTRYGLTEREVAVLRLIGEGLTNRQIGQRLFISTGTAAVHVSNILRKLGVTGRVQAATISHELGLRG